MCRFQGPDARLQPIDQREIIRCTSKQGLAKVDVRLDEAGDNHSALRFNDRRTIVGNRRRELRYASILDQQITFQDDVATVERYYGRAFYEQRFVHFI